ncbi:equilibrative nucleoside transporter, putative [Perkinsus marinus ATCC 50983]|uniref:Equilibrative nucleoside transporter, putative n=2 Tax=Perkinsus marinus (strain ATCC 50983 / TXsc) TaxID=423536 RepID=C5LPI6_PERM5|nr:equilibrative nucleoside transporter, putative [Perkinsus marinus ATCC 50983]EER01306.1 equilibrative nucleoside transporter, putative [Perkinsus marinus ATCC 50983]|eukprot:XP_002768588.1 equilibrative nucleoside transporter, putative [Perkinsus marinus ATCC 50983]
MFCVVGCVALLGWNFILGELGTLIDAFGDAYGTWCSLCFSLCINAGQLMLVWIGNRFKFGPRFYSGCIGMGISMILLAICAITFAQDNQSAGLAAGCIFVGLYGFANAVMESTMFGLAALVGPVSTQFILIGEGVSGLVAWPLDRLCEAIFRGSGVTDYAYPRMILFFGIGMIVNFASVPMYKYSMQHHPVIVKALEIEEGRQEFILKKKSTRPLSKILRDVAPQALTVWFSFTISYTVFPWTVFEMSPSSLSPVTFGKLMTYCYQVCDTIGRASPFYHLRLGKRYTPYAATARLIFIPLFFLCIHLSCSPFTQDWFHFVIMALLGLTNGILAASCMIYGPTQVDQNKKEELEIAGYVMSFGLICGILTGSVIATIIKRSAYM